MATETTTRLKIQTDDKEVKKLGQTITQALDPRSAKALKVATRDLERQFAGTARAQADLIKQLDGVKKGTETYKKLSDELKTVKTQADLAQRALAQIEMSQRRQSRQAQEGRMRSFGLGMAQGAGVAQYLPSGPGAGSRLAGTMIGQSVRRGAGAAAAPFMTPGIGGVAQGLAGIPIVGGFAAGALQTAAGAYQSAVGFDRARLQNLYFANENLGRRTIDRQAGPAMSPAEARAQAAREISPQRTFVTPQISPEARQRAARAGAKLTEMGVQIRRGQPIELPEELKGTPGIGQLLNEFSAGREQRTVTEAEQRRVRAARAARVRELTKGFGGLQSGLGRMNLGTEFGIGPMQAEAMKGELFGARGGMFNQGTFNEALAAKVRFGVGMGQAGQFARMGMAGGGGTGNLGLAQVLQGAFVQGLRGSQVTEYLGTLVSLGQQAEKQGIKLDVAEFQKMTMSLKASGLQGLQGQRITGGLMQAAQGLSGRGVQSPMDVLMLRAAGFRPGEGLEGYAQAMKRLESPNQEMLNRLLGSLTEGTQGFGAGGRSLLVKRALGRIGVSVGMGQASQIIDAYKGGRPPDINDLLEDRERMGGAMGLVGEARARVGAGAGLTRTAARLEAQRIGVGQRATWVARFESNSLKAAGAMNNFSKNLNQLSGLVEKFVTFIDRFTKGGAAGTWGNIKAQLGDVYGMGQSVLPRGR